MLVNKAYSLVFDQYGNKWTNSSEPLHVMDDYELLECKLT